MGRKTANGFHNLNFAAIARELGIPDRQTVWAWFQEGHQVPPERVLQVEKVTGISRHRLRPDLYPRERRA